VVKDPSRQTYHFFMRSTKQMYYDPGLHNADIGIAMSHFELAARENGLDGRWQVSDPGLRPVPPGTEYRVSWFGA